MNLNDKIVGSKVQFEIDDLDAFKRELRKGHLKFNASPADHNMISNAQRKKIMPYFMIFQTIQVMRNKKLKIA